MSLDNLVSTEIVDSEIVDNADKKLRQVQYPLISGIQEKVSESISTTDELKTAIWAPVSKIPHNSVINKEFIKNGRKRIIACDFAGISEIYVEGEILTQTHKDVVDSIFATNRGFGKNHDGDYISLISVYEVLSLISGSTSNYKWLADKIKEIKKSVITFVPKSGKSKDYMIFNIFDTIYYDDDKKMYAVVINKQFLNFFIGRLTIDYSKHLSLIANVAGEGSGFIKAAMRFFISQNMKDRDGPYVIKLDTLLEKIDQPRATPRQKRSAVSYAKKFKDELAKICVQYDSKAKLFFYYGADDLYFKKSLFDDNKEIENKSKA